MEGLVCIHQSLQIYWLMFLVITARQERQELVALSRSRRNAYLTLEVTRR